MRQRLDWTPSLASHPCPHAHFHPHPHPHPHPSLFTLTLAPILTHSHPHPWTRLSLLTSHLSPFTLTLTPTNTLTLTPINTRTHTLSSRPSEAAVGVRSRVDAFLRGTGRQPSKQPSLQLSLAVHKSRRIARPVPSRLGGFKKGNSVTAQQGEAASRSGTARHLNALRRGSMGYSAARSTPILNRFPSAVAEEDSTMPTSSKSSRGPDNDGLHLLKTHSHSSLGRSGKRSA